MEIRCFCSRAPLLAMGGTDARTREPFVHIKSARGKRLNVEAVITSGSVRLRCRDCFRWHVISIVSSSIRHKPEDLPATIKV